MLRLPPPPAERVMLLWLPLPMEVGREMLPTDPALRMLLPMEEREMLLPAEREMLPEGREMLLPVERMGEVDTLRMFDWMLLFLNEEP